MTPTEELMQFLRQRGVRAATIAKVCEYPSLAALRKDVESGDVLHEPWIGLQRCNELRAAFGLHPWATPRIARGMLSPTAWRIIRSYESLDTLRHDAATGGLRKFAYVGPVTEREIKEWLSQT